MKNRHAAVPLSLVLMLELAVATAMPGAARADPAAPDSVGAITGRLRLGTTGAPIGYANLIVIGTRRGAQSDVDGTFRITEVPPGPRTVRILQPGSDPLNVSVQVVPGENPLGDLLIDAPPVIPARPVTIGNLAEVSASELEAEIRPAQKVFHVGDAPKFDVRIHNRGKAIALLVRSVDGSDSGKSPRVKIAIVGPEGGFEIRPYGRCGNTNGIREEDFVDVPPGAEFDPYATGWVGANLVYGRFTQPGRYTATFHYVTTETDPRRWLRGPCSPCEAPPLYRELLARVTAVELTATTTFQVKR
jgi:hypothetical protein